MATPIIDLHGRMRSAGLSEAQADAIAAGFEALRGRVRALEKRLIAAEGQMATLQGKMLAPEGRMTALEGWGLERCLARIEARLAVIQRMAIGVLALQAMSLALLLHLVTTGGA